MIGKLRESAKLTPMKNTFPCNKNMHQKRVDRAHPPASIASTVRQETCCKHNCTPAEKRRSIPDLVYTTQSMTQTDTQSTNAHQLREGVAHQVAAAARAPQHRRQP
eukprot:scaffold89119_cov14-Tisochrysis_lutea.AAC.1